METHGLPRWALPAAIAGVVLLLVLRGKSAGAATTAAASPANDPLQAAAQQLQAQAAAAQQQQQLALQGVATTGQAEQQTLMDCKKLFADPAYACPGGGRPRVVTTSQWPFVGCGCIGPRTGAITLGSAVGFGQQVANLFTGVTGLFGGGGGGAGSTDSTANIDPATGAPVGAGSYGPNVPVYTGNYPGNA